MSTREDIRRAKEKLDRFLSESSVGIAESKINKDAVDAIVKAAERLSKAEQELRWNWQAAAIPITMLASIVSMVISTITTVQANESAKKAKEELEKQTQITRAESAIALALEHSKTLYGDNVPTQTWSTALVEIQSRAQRKELKSVAEGLSGINALVLDQRKSELTKDVPVTKPEDKKQIPAAEKKAQDIGTDRLQRTAQLQPGSLDAPTKEEPLTGKLVFCQGFKVSDSRRKEITNELKRLGAKTFPWQQFKISIPNEVRYYFPADEVAASSIASLVTTNGRNRPTVKLVTNSRYLKRARQGLIEVWLGEDGSRAASTAAP